jgi:hypothetical protein
MNETVDATSGMKKLGTRSSEEDFALELAHLGRFSAGAITGAPVPGIGESDRGILPEPYWAAAGEAVYAVFSYGTPIAWRTTGGEWQVPMERYSNTTNRHREKIIRALDVYDVAVERI